MLLDAGANLEAKSSSGATALMFASAAGYTDVVKLLLARGADANARVEVGHRSQPGIRLLPINDVILRGVSVSNNHNRVHARLSKPTAFLSHRPQTGIRIVQG